ncbi:MAG: hypothetical protein KAT25_03705 [Sulfuriflexus sp.]|nr:hypothetical protein [Sulfuriflexus sp.]
MEFEVFSLKDREEVKTFETLLKEYVNQQAQFSLSHISLVDVYDSLQIREDGGKVFTAILDITINFMLLHCDSHRVGATWNQYFSKGKLEGGSILDSQVKFSGKMEIHRFNSSFVLRYRALWDKLMGFLILYYSPKNYDKFCKSKSRKRSFKSLSKDITQLTDEFVQSVEGLLTEFDNKFRTPEAHGTGALRKYSFTMESMGKNPQVELIGFWNVMNEMILNIGKEFKID